MRLESEWLETNGEGGFACGCVDGEIRRRWHGLLWSARQPPRDRIRLIAGLEETLRHPMMTVSLSATWEGDRWAPPAGWPDFISFPAPAWHWDLEGGAVLHKRVVMRRESSQTLVIYWLIPSPEQSSLRLAVRPILPMECEEETISPSHYLLGRRENVPLYLHCNHVLDYVRRGEPMGYVINEIERDCEDDDREPLFYGPELSFTVSADEPVALSFSTEPDSRIADFSSVLERECERRLSLVAPKTLPEYAALAPRLAHAADQFIVRDRATGLPTILAGYPWFADWGRDTMIALPGLTLPTGRKEDARRIIDHFLHHLKDGLIPNIFPESGQEPRYNTVDATLWLIEAFFSVYTPAEIPERRHLWEALASIIHHYEHGAAQNIAMDSDGLIGAGEPGTQLTWMDVKVNGEVPTPRHGKPVEIQGLWYNALRLMSEAAEALGEQERAAHYSSLAERCAASFAERFVSTSQQWLNDVADRDAPGTADPACRPNMVIPFALRHNVIPAEKRADVLRAAAERLLTARGLRSLSQDHPDYKGIYAGNVLKRDRAYHQGTVWLWLLMPYVKGVRREAERVPELAEKLPSLLKEAAYHFESEGCLNQASEIADGDIPHAPRGCFAQAWSTAAIIEALLAV